MSNVTYPRRRAKCRHTLLVDCPLTSDDWRVVFYAMLGFREVCRLVSDQAHERAKVAESPSGAPLEEHPK